MFQQLCDYMQDCLLLSKIKGGFFSFSNLSIDQLSHGIIVLFAL